MLKRSNLGGAVIERGGHGLVHRLRIGTFDEIRRVAIPFEQVFHLFMSDACKEGGIVNLVTVQVEDR